MTDITELAVEPAPPAPEPVLPARPARAALPAPAPEAERDPEEPGLAADEVVPFGIFDPFADDLEASR